jgi:hypothetical protein
VALAQDGLAAAKAAQEAAAAAHASGGGTMATVGTGVLSFLIGLLALYPKTRAAGLALQQIVGGVQAVRKKMNPGEWKATVAPALAATTDDATKRQIDHILAQLPKAAA